MCAESSILWTTSGTGDGSASGYTMAQFTEWQRMLFAGLTGADLSGVSSDYLNELAATGTATPVAINTGGAITYGFPYFNSASVNVTIPTPSTSTRIDRIVLRASWAAQTVRITRIAGTEGAGAPALVQTAGTTWDMALAQASITTGGVITLTDQREWLTTLGDGMVTQGKLALLAVDTAQIAASAVTQAKLGSDTLQMLIIPITTSIINVTASTSYAEAGPTQGIISPMVFDVDKLPAGCTVKFCTFLTTASGTGYLELYNKTNSASVSGSEVSTTSGTFVNLESGDIKANLTAGQRHYIPRYKSSGASIAIQAIGAYLKVEWT